MRGLPASWLQKPMGGMKLGEILVDHGVLNKSQLACVLGMQQETDRRLGELIVDLSIATPGQVKSALDEQRRMEIS
jgi:hypothetical protein